MSKETQEGRPTVPKRLERVGVTNLRTLVKTGFGGHTYKFVPTFDVYIDLAGQKKGVHMSRLVESISEVVTEESAYQHKTFEDLEKAIIERLAEKHPFSRAEVGLRAELVVGRKTPASGRETMETHDVSVRLIRDGEEYTKVLKVSVVGNTACPHSKDNTGQPHIQRAVGELEITCGLDNKIGLGEMIKCVESAFSSPVYTLVKTEDENEIVKHIYENPKFVEDVTRGILDSAGKRFKRCRIKARTLSQESIHRHDVVAEGSDLY